MELKDYNVLGKKMPKHALRRAARAAVENNANSADQMLNVSPTVVMTTIIPWTLRRCAKIPRKKL